MIDNTPKDITHDCVTQLCVTAGRDPRHQYLLTRRLERAAALLRNTDHSVADICFEVGLASVGSFTTSLRRVFGWSCART